MHSSQHRKAPRRDDIQALTGPRASAARLVPAHVMVIARYQGRGGMPVSFVSLESRNGSILAQGTRLAGVLVAFPATGDGDVHE